MKLVWKTTALIAGLLVMTGSSALAVIFDDRSPAQKLRADIGGQMTRYTKCLGNAALACERTGALPVSWGVK